MKKLYSLVFLLVSVALFAQGSDSFSYTGALKDNGWGSQSGTSGQITTVPSSLSFAGLTSSGNKAQIVAGYTEDINLLSAVPLTGVAYYSALINLPNATGLAPNTATGSYFLNFGSLSATVPPTYTTFSGRVYIKAGAAADTFTLGILNGSGGTATPTFSATSYSINTTYLVIVKFNFATNTASLFVNPTLDTEGFATASNATGTSGAPTQMDGFIIRTAGTATAGTGNVEIDEVKFGSTWASVTQSTTTTPTIPNPTASAQSFCTSGTVADLVVTGLPGATFSWFDVATGGTALSPSTALTTANYYVSQTTPETTTALNSSFASPVGVAVQADGKILVADTNNNVIKRMNADGTGSVAVGSGFFKPFGVAVQADGKILVADTYNNAIKRMDADGTNIETLGIGFNFPIGIAVQSDGKIVVADHNNNAVKRMDADGTNIVTLGSGFATPTGVAVQADGKILVADSFYKIARMNADGNGIETLGTGFTNPTGIAVQADGKIIVADNSTNAIKRMNADGTGIETLGTGFSAPYGVAVQSNGAILVADSGNNAIKKITLPGTSNRVLVSVTVGAIAGPTANAQTFCANITRTVADLVANGTALKWYADNTTTIELASTDVIATGTYYVSQTLNGCESTRTPVSVTLNVTPPPAATAQAFCGSAIVANLVASGTNLRWYASSTSTTFLFPNAAITTGTYYVSQSINNCRSTRTQVAVTVTIDSPPTANAQTFCGSKTVADLAANGTALQWYADQFSTIPLASTDAIATGTYYVSQTVDTCESTRTPAVVTVNVTPPPTSTAQAFCGSATVADLVATGTLLRWYSNNGTTTALLATAAITTGNYYVSQSLNGCRSTRTQVAVTVTNATAPTASAQTFCGSKTVADLVAIGTALKWYATNTSTAVLAATATIATGTYYVSQTINTCESTRTSVAVTFNVTPLPAATAQTFCSSATVADLQATGTALKWYNVATNGTVLPLTSAITSGNYYVSQTLNSCESARTLVAVTIIPFPFLPNYVDLTACDSYTLPVDANGGTYYTGPAGMGNILSPGTVITATQTIYVYKETGTTPNCFSESAFTITINQVPIISPIAPGFVCDSYIIPNYFDPMFTITNPITKFYKNPGGPANNPLPTDQYLPGEVINNFGTTPLVVTIYAHSAAGSVPCFADEPFVVTIYHTPVIVPAEVVDVTACDSYVLPTLTVGNYFSDAAHIQPMTNLVLTAPSTVVYVYAENPSNPNCTVSDSFVVTIVTAPAAPSGAATQTFTVATLADATIANLVVTPSNVIWYASLTDAQTGTNPLQNTTVLTSGATYYAVNVLTNCSSTPFAVTADVILGADTFESLSFKYYPNPTTGLLNISYSKVISEINLLNVLGQKVLHQTTNGTEIQLDLTSFPSATYLVKVVSDGKTKTFKVVKG